MSDRDLAYDEEAKVSAITATTSDKQTVEMLENAPAVILTEEDVCDPENKPLTGNHANHPR
jgi:hypothetical protein